MRGYRVTFMEVGRDRKTWERVFPAPLDPDAVAAEASTALMSRNVDVTLDVAGGTGSVFAGAHRVGSISILPCLVVSL